ncbi:MAG: zinc-ribbon domain-containing protein [Clostridia bacterium]|nr:zinc-ribbon domain-containing protein [Clostridia bacterium]
MPRELECLRCGSRMRFVRRTRIQLGQTGWFLGDLPNLIAGSMELDVYSCTGCGKVEFFQCEESADDQEDRIAQIKCPKCGREHDLDDVKCPFCGFRPPEFGRR